VQKNQKKKQKADNDRHQGMKSYVKYTGMAFQMIVIILIFYWAGSKLDQRAANDNPVYTAILSLLGVFIGLYVSLRDFIFTKNDQ
jgi:uncharacterized membrane protein (DUF106 family)